MRDWKRFLAPVEITKKVRTPKIACKDLKDLNDLVAEMPIVPFRGLAILLTEDNHGPHICPKVESVSEYYGEILSRIPMNSLHIGWMTIRDRSEEDRRRFLCPAIQLLLKITKEHCHKLMGLTIDALPPFVQLYSREDVQTGAFSLPELRALLICNWDDDEYPPNLLEDLVTVAPKLEYLQAKLTGQQLEQLPEDKYKVLQRLTLEMFKVKLENTYYNLALAQPKLVNLRVSHGSTVGRINFHKWMETLKLIFRSSSSDLEKLHIDSYTLSLIIKHQLCVQPLQELEKLEIATGISLSRRATPSRDIIAKLNFPSLFPKVKQVTVYATYPDQVLPAQIVPFDIEEELIDADEASLSTEYIKELVITRTRTSRRFRHYPALKDKKFLKVAYHYWARLFPHITSLTVSAQRRDKIPFMTIWMKWQKLEELRLNLSLIQTEDDVRNFDKAFCGIHPAELKLLRKESKEFLRKVNLVTLPSITNLQRMLEF